MQKEIAKLLGGIVTNLSKIQEILERSEIKEESQKSVAIANPTPDGGDSEGLTVLTHTELKQKAKELGLKTTGTKDVLLERINEHLYGKTMIGETASTEPTVSQETTAQKPDSDEPTETGESIHDIVTEMVKDLSLKDLREILEENGIESDGKRQALIAKIVTAVEEGVISLYDEEDEDGEEEVDYNDPETMTEERAKAIEELEEGIRGQIEEEELTEEEMMEFVEEFGEPSVNLEEIEDFDQLVEIYIALASRLIDDEGNLMEFE